MKVAFCTNCIKDIAVEDSLPILSGLGYDGVEFWDSYLRGCDLDKLKAILRRVGLECVQVCPYFDFTGGKESWNRSIDEDHFF